MGTSISFRKGAFHMPPTKRRKLSILTVWAHVGDHCDTAVGARIIHADLGDEITSVVCTDGLRHHAEALMHKDEAPGRSDNVPFVNLKGDWNRWAQMKRKQALRASEIMGVKETIFLGWDEDDIYIRRNQIQELGEIVLRTKPDLVITHLPIFTSFLGEGFHTAAARVTVHALGWAGSRIRQFDGVPAHRVKEVMFSPQGGEIADSRDPLVPGVVPDVWVDITPVIERKVLACDCLSVQGRDAAFTRKWIEAQDGRWGILAGCSYAEPFIRGGRTYAELPMPEQEFTKKFKPSALYGQLLSASKVPYDPALHQDVFNDLL